MSDETLANDKNIRFFYQAPSCVEYPLDFSIHAFEHLEGVALRGQVPNSPEADLLYQVGGRENW